MGFHLPQNLNAPALAMQKLAAAKAGRLSSS
jgi:hypothetical protein